MFDGDSDSPLETQMATVMVGEKTDEQSPTGEDTVYEVRGRCLKNTGYTYTLGRLTQTNIVLLIIICIILDVAV